MAATNIDSWPRDSRADANPDLTRKRQRLSEEADDASPLSDSDDIIIEALPLEEDGDSPATAIELSDDFNPAMAAFSNAFVLDPAESIFTPSEQIGWLRERMILKDALITPQHFRQFTSALSNHIDVARRLPDKGRGKYALEQEFFDILGEACYMILASTHHFMDAKLVEAYGNNMCHSITEFMQALHEICLHALRIIPPMMEKTTSRRDSGVGGRTAQRPPLLWFVRALDESLRCPAPASAAYFRELGYVQPKYMRRQRRDQFLEQKSTLWLTKLLEKLVDYDHNLREDAWDAQAWEAIGALLRIVDSLGNDLPLPFIDPVLQVLQRHIFKAIAGRKSAGLPISIHELCVQLSCNLLDLNMKQSDPAQLARTYDKYVADSEDAPFLLDSLSGKTSIECLRHISDDDMDTMKELIAKGWIFDKLTLFIHSSFMDVRNIGITLFSGQLLEVFKRHSRSSEGLNHPVLQYAARFMRSKKLIDHIYGSDSHHSLIAHSHSIICFLAAVSEYRNDDTDTIWHTCTDSKEAEKIRATVSIIHQLLQHLDYDQMVHLARKYTMTESSKLSKDVIQLLGILFNTIRAKAGELDLERPLETAYISVDIYLNHEMDELRDIAMTELLWFTQPAACRADDRILLYQRFVPQAGDGTSHGTAAAHILSVFLERAPCSPEEGQIILDLLPAQAVIEGLSSFVQSCRTANEGAPPKLEALHEQRLAIITRLHVVFRLLALSREWDDDAAKDHLFDVAFGKLALDNDSRDLAWQSLLGLSDSQTTAVASVAREVRDHYLLRNALRIDMAFVTPQLMHLIGRSFTTNSVQVSKEEDIMPAFEHDTWKRVLAGAESSNNVQVNRVAAQIVCNALFDPASKRPAQLNSQFQSEFTRSYVSRICENASRPSDEHDSITYRQLALLETVLCESCKHLSCSISTALEDISLASSPDQASLCCTMQVYGTGPEQPKIFQVRASPQATVSELAEKLPQITGASENRVIISGKLLDLDANSQKSLVASGVKSSGVIQVSPKHTYTSNLDDLLTPVGAVESQIMRQYASLEKLLYCSEQVARKAYTLLTKVRPPARERQRVTCAAASFVNICPKTAPWRTALTIHTLQTHLADFARICVVDANFFKHGTQLLVAIIMDEDRMFEPSILIETMECLIVFLRERTDETATVELVSDPDAFVARMAVICLEVCQQDLLTPAQCFLAERTFMALIQTSQHQDAVWSSFKKSPLTRELHRGLFFSTNDDLSRNTMTSIKNLCKQSTAAPAFYTSQLYTLTGPALSVQTRAAKYFELMNDVLLEDSSLRENESRARCVMEELISDYLKPYQHLENVDLPQTDPAVAGLLKVVQTSVDIVGSYKHGLLPGGDISNFIFNCRLFPLTLGLPGHRALLDVDTRRMAYRLARAMHSGHDDIAHLLEFSMREMLTLSNDPSLSFPGRDIWLRPVWKHSGLQNLGMTCYMNALLQQLFANVHFRQFIFSLPLDTGKQRILAGVRRLFAHMQSGYFEVPDTAPLANALGIEPGVMEDVHTFYANLLARLESEMPNAESKAKLNSFYGGKQLSQTMGECGHISSKEEAFGEIGLTVQHKSGLLDSLNEWVQGEAMEGANKYRCSACDHATDGRLVNAMKRLSIEELSDNITFCLKRFKFDLYGGSVKINDRFEFPQFIDMARYTRKYLEKEQSPTDEDIFELVGVIVQKGQLDFGHYWSYTLIRNTSSPQSREWVKLDDSNTFRVSGGLAEVQQECFGDVDVNGNQRADNAYVLFYQRKRVLEEQIGSDFVAHDARSAFLLPPAIPLPPEQVEVLHEENVTHQKIAHLFDDDFNQFLEWLANKAEEYSRASATDDGHTETLIKRESEHVDLMRPASKALTILLQRVIACDKDPQPKLDSMMAMLKKLLSASTTVASDVVCQILEEAVWYQKVIVHRCAPLRRAVYDVILTCLKKLKASDPSAYSCAMRSVTNTHSVYLQHDSCPVGGDYIAFAADLASLGADEALHILQEGYLAWAMDILRLPWSSIRQKARPQLYELVKKDRGITTAAYGFINRLLEGAVKLDASSGTSCAIKTDAGVLLGNDQYDELLCMSGSRREILWWLRSARFALQKGSWESFEPGKLLANLYKLVPDAARSQIEDNLLDYVATEDTSFPAIMRLAMHYLNLQPRSQQAVDVCGALVKTVLEWEGAEAEFAAHIEDLYGLSKAAVLASLNGRLLRFLKYQRADVRVHTANWLAKEVFTGPAITEAMDLDEERAQRAKEVIETACPWIQRLYNEERARVYAEPMIKAAKSAAQHLHRLQEEAARIRADQDDGSQLLASAPPTFSRKLNILIDEAPRVAAVFDSQYQEFVKFWVGEQPVSYSTNVVQDSAEASDEEGVDDDLSSDAEYDEDDEDVMTLAQL